MCLANRFLAFLSHPVINNRYQNPLLFGNTIAARSDYCSSEFPNKKKYGTRDEGLFFSGKYYEYTSRLFKFGTSDIQTTLFSQEAHEIVSNTVVKNQC